MNIISMPPFLWAVKQTLKRDEEIVCTNAVVIADSGGNVTWVDKDKLFNIICRERPITSKEE